MDIISAKVHKVTFLIKRNYIHAPLRTISDILFRCSAVTLLRRGVLPGLISPRLPCLV